MLQKFFILTVFHFNVTCATKINFACATKILYSYRVSFQGHLCYKSELRLCYKNSLFLLCFILTSRSLVLQKFFILTVFHFNVACASKILYSYRVSFQRHLYYKNCLFLPCFISTSPVLQKFIILTVFHFNVTCATKINFAFATKILYSYRVSFQRHLCFKNSLFLPCFISTSLVLQK